MIGSKGSLRHIGTQIHNVPLLFCPVCHRYEIHYKVESEYDILAEYAYGDGAAEVNFEDYVNPMEESDLYDNCVSVDTEEQPSLVRNQIDMALDLLAVAMQLRDDEWTKQLKRRLIALNARRNKLLNNMSSAQ
jgi:hypothetical protein